MLRVALLGYGYWGPTLLRNFAEAPGARVAGVAELHPRRLEAARASHPEVRLTAKSDELLDDPEVDAVAIATPVRTHFELARRALENGKHVLVEKPLATSSLEVQSLIDLSRRVGKTLMVDHVFCFHPAVQRVKSLIDDGQLGELYYFDSVRINLGLFQHDVNVLWDLAPHDLSIMDHLIVEQPRSVSALGSCHANSAVESIAYLTVRFSSGLLAHFHNNWLAPAKVRTIMIGGSKRMVVFDDMQSSEKLKIHDRGVEMEQHGLEEAYRMQYCYRLGDMWSPRLDPIEPLKQVVAHFLHCCHSGEEPRTGGPSGLRVVRLLEAADRSMAQSGREVEL
jgi:predicted dehydrogenase